MSDTQTAAEDTARRVQDPNGGEWLVVAAPTKVAHLKQGAVLAFRPADDAGAEPLRTPVEFNSAAAAEFAIRTMSEKEIQRRLTWAKTDAGIR